MASKRKRKHLKNKRKHKERRKLRKQQNLPRLAYDEYLHPYKEVIYEHYKPTAVSLYRWVHDPNVPDDFKPQIFQDISTISPEKMKAPEVDALEEAILQYTSRFTLSHFVTPDEAMKAWQQSLGNLLKKVKPEKQAEKTENWIKKKGQYVVKINYTEESGLIGPQTDGSHKEIFLYEETDVASLIDRTFPPIKIEIQ